MLTQFYVTGDTHGDFLRFQKLSAAVPDGETWGVIILGDAGLNFWMGKRDDKNKYRICSKYPNLVFYCVRGNHEARPSDVFGMVRLFDEKIQGSVYLQLEYPRIRYLIDGQDYNIAGYHTLVLGGAYSIDKWYRIQMRYQWFQNEQLHPTEMKEIEEIVQGHDYDLILSHTCPRSFQPTDLFLSFIDLSTVDNSMDLWMEALKDKINWKYWCFGHYHEDRCIQENVYMLFNAIVEIHQLLDKGDEND